MLDERLTAGLILTLLGLALLTFALPGIEARPALRRWSADEIAPVAALAWAQSNCGAQLVLREDRPRPQAEDFLRSVFRLDSRSGNEGLSQACNLAERMAIRVAAVHRHDERARPAATFSLGMAKRYLSLASYGAAKAGR